MKIRLVILIICGFFLLHFNVSSQYKTEPAPRIAQNYLTGNLTFDLTADTSNYMSRDTVVSKDNAAVKKYYSTSAAGLFSLVIPGAGQFYTKSYLEGSLFLGGEIALWIVYMIYEKNGDDKENSFRQYADQNWSVVRYANWINVNFGQSIVINTTESNLSPWERVDWNQLNNVEEAIGSDLTIQPTGFTHKLAPHGDQQYYEMIGKYSQFGSGWDDASWFTKADVLANNGIGNVSPHFLAYSKMRGDANDYYNIGTTVSYVIILNHVLSAVEAVWNASRINKKIRLEAHIEPREVYGNMVEFVPTLHVKCEL